MRKILSLFAAMLFAFAANATVRNITPTHCFEGDRTDGYTLYVELARGAQAGDTIVMADGEYLEGQSIPVNVPVVIMAAEGAHPVVKMSGYFQVHASMKVEGVKFQFVGAETNGYCFYFYENSSKYLVLEGCEFQNFTQYVASSWEAYHIDSCIVNNCYFHDLAKAPFYFAKSTLPNDTNACDNLTVKNSTFANITLSQVAVLDLRNNNNSTAATSKLRVDHCTFYNCKGYERMIQSYKSPDVVVCNCIMMNPLAASEEADIYATYLYGGSVHHNLNYQTKRQYGSGVTVTDSIQRDPQFVDAANGDLHLALTSPAIGAGSDGSTLGDPRWWPAAPVPPTPQPQTATYVMTPNNATTGSASTSYVNNLTEFTYEDISWKMVYWNPSTLQVKTNQDAPTAEFRMYTTSAFPGKIKNVVVTFSALTLKNTSSTGFMFVGGSEEVTATTGGTAGVWDATAKTLTWTPDEADNFTYFALYQNGKVATGTNKLADSAAIVITYEPAPAPAVIKPVIAGETSFYGETEVTITCDTEGAAIYYTLDGTEPTAASTQYTAAFKLNATATVKAIAILGDDASAVAEKTFTKNPSFASFEALIAAGVADKTLVEVSFADVLIDSIYVNSSSIRKGVYFTVGGKAYEIYYSNGDAAVPAEWVAGGKVSGTIRGNWTEYKGLWEIVPTAPWTWAALTYAAPTPVVGATNYYLVGSMNNWTPGLTDVFGQNPGAEGEYMAKATLAVGDEFKVMGITSGVLNPDTTWYPDGMGTNYIVDADHAGAAKNIYFRPDGQGGEGWHHGVIFVEPNPAPQPSDWAVIKFTKVVPKDSLAADASFVLFGSEFKGQITDTDNKMEIDSNVCRFGSAEGYEMFTHRLKSGGKSSSKNFITLTIPEDGKLAIAVRTGSNSATDRNLVIKQGNDTLFNQLILESQAIEVMEDTTKVKVYPYVSIPVEAGNVVLSYPVGSLNFYAFAFKPEPIPVYYMKNNWNEGQWLWREMTRNGMSYKLDSVVYGGNGVNYNTAESDEGATWVPDSMILGDEIAAKDTVSFVLNPIAKTVTANLVGKYVKPADQLSCAEIYALADSAAVLMNGVVVTYVNGSNIFVKDETGAMLIYLPKNTSVAWKPGDILSNVRGIKVTYKGLVEVSPTQAQVAAVEAIEGYVPAPEELTFVDETKDMNKYIIVKGIEFDADTAFVAGSNGTLKINLGNQAIDLFNKFKLGYEFKAGKKYDIVAIVSYYNALQLYFVSAEEQATIAYYVAGSMNGWKADEAYMLTPNNESLYEGEFTFAANDAFKVIGYDGTNTTWYPDGMGNDYKITEAGDYKITFNPAGNVEGWYAGYFNVVMKEAPIDTIPTTAPAAPTAAEDDVMAIYCNHYATNNLHFEILGWGGVTTWQADTIDDVAIVYCQDMKYEFLTNWGAASYDMSAYKKLHADLWAPAASTIRLGIEALGVNDGGSGFKSGVVCTLAEGWNSIDLEFSQEPDLANYSFTDVKYIFFEWYKTPEGESFENNPFGFANIYFYDKKAEGFENIDASVKAVKVLYNGQILILRGDKVYTVTGQPVK